MSYADDDRLIEKYVIARTDGKPFVGPAFVLAYARDPHARVALEAYATSVEKELPGLAADLRAALDETEPSR